MGSYIVTTHNMLNSMVLSFLVILLSCTTMCLAQVDTVTNVTKEHYIPNHGEVCSNDCSSSDPHSWCGQYKQDVTGRLLRCVEYTRFDQVCVDECRSAGESYTWCLTNAYIVGGGETWWDYCSVTGYT